MTACNDPRHDEIETWYRQVLEARSTPAEALCPHGVPDDDPCEPCEDYARRFSNLFEAPDKIVVLPPASWADGAADLLERALYLRSMTVEDADSVKAVIEEHLAVAASQERLSIDVERLAFALHEHFDEPEGQTCWHDQDAERVARIYENAQEYGFERGDDSAEGADTTPVQAVISPPRPSSGEARSVPPSESPCTCHVRFPNCAVHGPSHR
jgi:hypothetical protein